MEIFLVAILIGLVPALVAKSKGRSFVLWWIYGVALFIIALPHSLIMKTNLQGVEKQHIRDGLKKCPSCAEFIKADASVCRFCGRDVAP